MHIKSKHPEIHDASRVEYVKSKHAINGLPQCFFCQKMLCDNHSLEKHITMGGCMVIKAAVGKGQSIDELEKEICMQHQSSPPEVPEQIRALNRSSVLLKDRRPMYFAQRHHISEFAESIHSIGPRCVLCGQILLDKSRIKTHGRKSHPTAWRKVSAEAMRICGSLKSVFKSPCQFCSSSAKNLSLHANQCSSLFQVCAGMLLSANNYANAAEADAKTPQTRRSAAVAAYTQVDIARSPLARAFRAGAEDPAGGAQVKSPTPHVLQRSQQTTAPPTSRLSNRTSSATGTVQQTSILRFAAAAPRHFARDATPWTLRLLLRSPHQLCYVNSSTIAMLHVLQQVSSRDLRSLTALCKQAADAGAELLLHSQLVVRSAVPRWIFNAEQKDASEFLFQYMQVSASTWSRWESRRQEEGSVRITDYGGLMLFAEVEAEGATSLTAILQRWSQGHSLNGVAEERSALVVQLGRYVNGHKNCTAVDFEQEVAVPTFSDGVTTQTRPYMVHSAIVHQGPAPPPDTTDPFSAGTMSGGTQTMASLRSAFA